MTDTKFHVTYDSKKGLEAGCVTDLPCYTPTFTTIGKEQAKGIFSQLGLWIAAGEMDFQPASTLNAAFPDIKAMTVREFLELSWKV
jgi:hypothetical protein